MKKILIVDGQPGARDVLSLSVKCAGLVSVTASNSEDAMKIMEEESIDGVFINYQLDDTNGEMLTKAIRQKYSPAVVITGMALNEAEDVKNRFLQAGVNAFLYKPCSFEDLNDHLYKYYLDPSSVELDDERRASPRYSGRGHVTVDDSCQGEISDISRVGARFFFEDAPVQDEKDLSCDIFLGAGQKISASGTVVWEKEVNNGKKGRYIGVKFDSPVGLRSTN